MLPYEPDLILEVVAQLEQEFETSHPELASLLNYEYISAVFAEFYSNDSTYEYESQ